MLRLIFILVFLLCVFVGALGWALNHWFGWKGMLAFPFVLLVVLWIGKKLVGALIKRFALGLFSMKSGVLKGASIQVHSIIPVASTPNSHDSNPDDTDSGDNGEEADNSANEDTEVDADSDEADEPDTEPEQPKERFEVDITITPREGCGDRVWEPGELVLTLEAVSSLEDIEEKEIGTTENVLIWKDSGFHPDEEGKYPGAQRLKLTIAVQPSASKAWLQYYNQSLGEITLPPWTSASESPASSASESAPG